MQEEIENKSVTLIINSSKLTARTLATAFMKFLRYSKGKLKEHHDVKPQGKQTVKELIAQNQGVEKTELADKAEVKTFDHIAKQYGGVDVAFGSFGCNPMGMQDKMEASDIIRMAEALQCKVVIPIHWDVWTNFEADLREIEVLYNMRKERLGYKFKPYYWKVGGHYTYPTDFEAGKKYFVYQRGFEDCFDEEPNVPFRSVL